jgi:hypothetical protein
MAEKQELEICIAHDGTVTINVQGAKGKACLELTRDIEEALGVVVEREKKPSFYEEDKEAGRIAGKTV